MIKKRRRKFPFTPHTTFRLDFDLGGFFMGFLIFFYAVLYVFLNTFYVRVVRDLHVESMFRSAIAVYLTLLPVILFMEVLGSIYFGQGVQQACHQQLQLQILALIQMYLEAKFQYWLIFGPLGVALVGWLLLL